MKPPGQPLRFLAVVLGCWVCLRVAMLVGPWATGAPDERPALASPAARGVSRPVRLAVARTPGKRIGDEVAPLQASEKRRLVDGPATAAARADGFQPLRAAIGHPAPPPAPPPRMFEGREALHWRTEPQPADRPPDITTQAAWPANPAVFTPSERRLSGQAWLLWRPDAGGGRTYAPLLGGSQMGVRLDYRLIRGRAGLFSLYGRASRALERPFAEEAAVGLAWRPGRLPVSLMVERRQRLGTGGRSGFALLAAGGLNPTEIASRVEAEGYAQAGIVGLPGSDGFADGKATLTYRMRPRESRPSVGIGAALSGSIQPGARRLDAGPELRLLLPAGARALRLSAEWRMRITGNARPASGPAITLVADF